MIFRNVAFASLMFGCVGLLASANALAADDGGQLAQGLCFALIKPA